MSILDIFSNPYNRMIMGGGIMDAIALAEGRPAGYVNNAMANYQRMQQMEWKRQQEEQEQALAAQQLEARRQWLAQQSPEVQQRGMAEMHGFDAGEMFPQQDPTAAMQNYQYSLEDPNFAAYQERMKRAGADSLSIDMGKDESEYLKALRKQEVTDLGEARTSARSAIQANQALDRFMRSSAGGLEGEGAPVLATVGGWLNTLGYDSDIINDTVLMQQATDEILANKMAALGARGLTDKDMEILQRSLPRVSTSHEARMEVARIIMKANNSTISDYVDMLDWNDERFQGEQFYRPRWIRGWEPMTPYDPTAMGPSTLPPRQPTMQQHGSSSQEDPLGLRR